MQIDPSIGAAVPSLSAEEIRSAVPLNLLADPPVDVVVVTHGTDTRAETAFFYDLLIDSPKPVVFTGAMPERRSPD